MSLRDAMWELASRWDDLPQLVGTTWSHVAPTVKEHVERLQTATDDEERALVARELLLLFKPYPAVAHVLTPALGRPPRRSSETPVHGVGEPSWELVITTLYEQVSDEPAHSAEPSAESISKHATTDRRINAWFSERPEGLRDPLRVGQQYTLKLQIGPYIPSSLIDDPSAVVPPSDVSPSGLDTTWVLSSFDVELASVSPEVDVTPADGPARPWTAQFALHIPAKGPSAIRQVTVVPRAAGDGLLEILIYAGAELYRQFKIRLATTEPQTKETATAELAAIQDDIAHVPVAHLHLPAVREWATPPGRISITIAPGRAFVMGEIGLTTVRRWTDWHATQAQVASRIKNTRLAAERFRSRWEDYLNDINSDDVEQRMQDLIIPSSWQALPDQADAAHRHSWSEVSRSVELHDLAFDGHGLYELFFPPSSELRAWMDELPLGQFVDITWMPGSDPGTWIPHIPWGLMYRDEAPMPSDPVDPMGFLGLRFRIGYQAHEVPLTSKALGGLEEAYRANLLYWGNQRGDDTGAEARWQRAQLGRWPNQVFIAGTESTMKPKQELIRLLYEPKPVPTTVLYLYCQCAGDPNDPILRFGSTLDTADVVRRTELGQRPFANRPLIFANSCTTTTTDPYLAGILEEGFFGRGARAFIGTETKVPIHLASRFALIFFSFFYRRIDPAPLAAGEAVVQSRLFLWTQYRNIGGLFYTYVNQYELFVASDDEVRALR